MSDERIMTLHPDPSKQGVRINQRKYDTIRYEVLQVLKKEGSCTYTELADSVRRSLGGRFDGSTSWYVTVLKLDLEARGVIERIPKTRPEKVRLG